MTAANLRPAWDVVLSLVAVLGSGALRGGLYGLCLSMPAFVLLRRHQVFRRKPRTWNLLAKLVYPYLLAVFVLGGSAVGGLLAAETRTDTWIAEAMVPLVRADLPTIKEWLSNKVDWGAARDFSLDDATQRVLRSLYYRPASDSWFEERKAGAVNYITLNLGKWVVTAGLGAIGAYAVGRTGDTFGLDPDTVRFSIDIVRETDLSRVNENFFRILRGALRNKAAKVFKVLYWEAGLIFGLALLLPVTESLIYFFWHHVVS